LSTALELTGTPNADKAAAIEDLVLRLPTQSVFAAELAVKYFHRSIFKHQLQPPLMAAVYNAGSLRVDASNAWNLRQYGDHIDRWVAYYNTSRLLSVKTAKPAALPAPRQTFEVKVVRKKNSTQSTLGELFINEQFHCYTLEDVVRPDGVKVYGETAIPGGRYKLAVTHSQRFQQRMPQILDVPRFEGVRIHAGNTHKDTLGCILVGKNQGEDRIWDCKGVYTTLLQQIDAFPAKNQVFISVCN
jgi:hypothetical protein